MKNFLIFIIKFFKSLNKKEIAIILFGFSLSLVLLIVFFNYFIKNIAIQEPSYGGVLKIGLSQNVDSINPVLAQNIAEKTLVNLIYDSLIRPDGNGGYEYELAEIINPIENGLKYEIILKDVYWSNGEKITADDIVMSFNYFKNYNEITKPFFKNAEIQKLDSKKCLITLKAKDNYFLQKLSFVKIIPTKVFSKYNIEDWRKNEDEIIKVTSGPFYFNRKFLFNNNIQVFEFLPNKYYFKKPYLEKIYVYIYPNFESAYIALKIKDINFLGGIKPSYVTSFGRSYKIQKIIFPRVIGLFFNSQKLNKNIKNLNSTIDRNYITKEIFENFGEPTYSIFSPSISKILNIKIQKLEYLENIKEDFENIEIIVPDNLFMIKIGEYLQKKFNFKISIKKIEEINNKIIPEKDYQALLYGISYNLIPDLRPFFDSASLFNLTQKDDSEILKKIQELENGSIENFKNNLELLSELINKKEPIIFIANPYYIYICDKNIKGINMLYLNDSSEIFDKIEDWYIKLKIKW